MASFSRFLRLAALALCLVPHVAAQNSAASLAVETVADAPPAPAAAPALGTAVASPVSGIPENGNLFYDNGPLANSQGTGTVGDDESILTEPETHFGFGAQRDPTINNAVFDDFTVPAFGVNLSSLIFFAYQSFSSPPTITQATVTIYNANSSGMIGSPVGGSCPNNTTYTSFNTTDTNVNRVTSANGGVDRQIQRITVTLASTCRLTAGTYWVGVQYSGNDAFSGPWVPPVAFPIPSPTCPGVQGMGAKQSLGEGLDFTAQPVALDTGGCEVDLPFQLLEAGGDPVFVLVTAAANAPTHPQGGVAGFTYQVCNATTVPLSGVVFYEVFRGSSGVRVAGPTPVQSGSLSVDSCTPTLSFSVDVPDSAPPDDYRVFIRAGPSVGVSIGNAVVPVTVTPAARTAGAEPGWSLAEAEPWPAPEASASAGAGVSLGAYPNPFRGRTEIAFSLDEAGSVRLLVFDMLGRRVATLVDEARAAGPHTARFEAAALPSGVYLVLLEAAGQAATQRITLVR